MTTGSTMGTTMAPNNPPTREEFDFAMRTMSKMGRRIAYLEMRLLKKEPAGPKIKVGVTHLTVKQYASEHNLKEVSVYKRITRNKNKLRAVKEPGFGWLIPV